MTTPIPPLRRFPDVQSILVYGMGVLVGGDDHVDIETPDNLEELLPFIRVRRRGGPSDGMNDHATIDIDFFDRLYADVEDLAAKGTAYLVGPPPPFWQFDTVACDVSPRELPWGDETQIRRFGATFTITSRRRGYTR